MCKKLAEKGNSETYAMLGIQYWRGDGVIEDYIEAYKWLLLAGVNGDDVAAIKQDLAEKMTPAQISESQRLAKEFLQKKKPKTANAQEGQNIQREDMEVIFNWLIKDAEKGNITTQKQLGDAYYYGMGIQRNFLEAIKWYSKAAQKGSSEAQKSLANMYYDGQGVVIDYVESYKWALIAGMNGENVSSIQRLLVLQMTPEQIDKAKKLAKEFVVNQ